MKKLDISGNKIVGEDDRLYCMLNDPGSMLEKLYMNFTVLSDEGAIKLFSVLCMTKMLKDLYLSSNIITDKACNSIIMAMGMNTSLATLRLDNNEISGQSAQDIVQALQQNNSLHLLSFPIDYSEDVKQKIELLKREVNEEREDCGCHVKLEIELGN